MADFDFQTQGVWQPGLANLEFRPYQPGDEHAILSTFNTVFRETNGPGFVDRTMDHWRWLYLGNPAGTRVHLAVAPDGKIAGQWAGLPVRMQTAFGERVFVQIVDTLVHPDYRKGRHDGPGVFALVGERGIKHWMSGYGDAALYGYPVPLAEKMGTRYLGYRRLRVVDYLCRAIGSVTRDPAGSSGLHSEILTEVSAECDPLFARMTASASCAVRRDRAYLQWRFLDCPGSPYELHAIRRGASLVGLMVLRPHHELVRGACTIADWVVPDRDAEVVDALLEIAEARGREFGRERLMSVFPDGAEEDVMFRSRGFEVVPSAQELERRLTYWTGPDAPEFSHDFLAEHWWYTLGDSDLV